MRLSFISFAILLSLVGCSRKVDGLSKISIQTPGAHGKVGALTALPVGRIACYGVSISGSGISGVSSNSCHPELGLALGFVSTGGELSGEVLKGSDRTFDVYLYLQSVGQNDPCPSMDAVFIAQHSPDIYKIGSLPSVNLEKDIETITITTTYPGDANSLYANNSYSSGCLPAPIVNRSGFQISSAADTSTGTGYILRAKVGRVANGPELTGTGYILKLKE